MSAGIGRTSLVLALLCQQPEHQVTRQVACGAHLSPVMDVAHAYGIDQRPLHGSEAVAHPDMGARHLWARQTPEGQQLQERY